MLLLERDGIDVDSRLRVHLEESGAAVTAAAGPGFGEMMAEPQHARPPAEVFATVDTWLEDTPREGRAAGPHVGVAESLDLVHEGATIRETPISIKQPFGRLFGVLAEPVDGPVADRCALLLNPGAIRHVGAGRMWVEIARRWAARGIPALRLDLEGIGDADGGDEAYRDVAAFHSPQLLGQVEATLDALEQRGLPRRFLLLGLCSGAYWSFQTALRDERVSAALLLNPRSLFWHEEVQAVRRAPRARWAREGSRWRRLVGGEVSLRLIMRVARGSVAAVPGFVRLAISRRWRRRELEGAFDQLRHAGRPMLLVFGRDEALADELEDDGFTGRLQRWPNLRLVRLSGNSHTFNPLRAQGRLHELVDRELERELGRAGAPFAFGPPRAPANL